MMSDIFLGVFLYLFFLCIIFLLYSYLTKKLVL